MIAIVSGITALTIMGCATSNYKYGRDFPGENAKQIVKGKTTTAQLVQMVGEPFSKQVISETEEKWTYTYINGSVTAQNYLVTIKAKTTGQQKSLDVLIKNGVVTNYVFNEGPTTSGNMN